MSLSINSPPTAPDQAHRFSQWASRISIAAGSIVLAGWLFGIAAFTSVHPGWATMKPITALAFVFSGAALGYKLLGPATHRQQKLFGRIASLCVLIIGFGTLLEEWLRIDFGVENILLGRMLPGIQIPHPGRMAPSTAIVFALLGSSLFTLDFQVSKKYGLSEFLALMSTCVGFLGFLGYLYNVKVFYAVSAYASMAIHTSLLSCLLGLGILAARPDYRLVRVILSKRLGGFAARATLPPAILLPIIFGLLRLEGQRRGWYGTEFGVGILVAGIVMVLVVVIWANARWLNKSDEERVRTLEHDHQLAAIVAGSADAIIGTTLEGVVTSWNSGSERLFGYSEKEVLGKSVSFLLPPDRLHELESVMQRIARGEHVPPFATQRLRKDGTAIDISLSVSPVFNAAGTVVGASAIERDITKIRQEQEKLRHSEERFSKSFQKSPIPIMMNMEEDGRYLDANEAFLKMTGYQLNELVGRTTAELGVWIFSEQRQAMREELSRTGRIVAYTTELRTKAGNRRTVQVSSERIVLGMQPCVLSTTVDVTEARKLEEQLRQSQKMEVVGRLAGGIAHDFNNLLGIILGCCDLAQTSADDPKTLLAYFAEVANAGDRAKALTRQLLAFSRKQVLQPRIVNLNEVVGNLDKILTRMLGENVALSFTLAPSLHNVKADPGQVEQVLMNLAINARDAMEKGGRLHIQTTNMEVDQIYAEQHDNMLPGNYVMLTVTDTGSGMDAQTRSKIFEPFFTTKAQGKGTGLGLSTVHGIVNQSGGQIGVYSEPGRGTTFRIYFPSVEAPADSISTIESEPSLEKGSGTILVVEDDEQLRIVIVRLLEHAGYRVVQAKNAEMAIALLEKLAETIDMLLTDVVMPGATGDQLATDVRNIRPEMKILYMSGYAEILVAGNGMLEVNGPILEKPFSQKALLAAVKRVLNQNAATLSAKHTGQNRQTFSDDRSTLDVAARGAAGQN